MSVDHKDPFSRVHEVKLGTRCGLSCVYTPEFGSAVTCGVGGDYRLLTGYENGFVFKDSFQEYLLNQFFHLPSFCKILL